MEHNNYRFYSSRWNYTAGSCAAGAVLGAWKRNTVLGSVGALTFSEKLKNGTSYVFIGLFNFFYSYRRCD